LAWALRTLHCYSEAHAHESITSRTMEVSAHEMVVYRRINSSQASLGVV
jgi:hypothetical protein